MYCNVSFVVFWISGLCMIWTCCEWVTLGFLLSVAQRAIRLIHSAQFLRWMLCQTQLTHFYLGLLSYNRIVVDILPLQRRFNFDVVDEPTNCFLAIFQEKIPIGAGNSFSHLIGLEFDQTFWTRPFLFRYDDVFHRQWKKNSWRKMITGRSVWQL